MKALSVIELAKLYSMNRQSIYKRINKGDLSKNSDGKIDLAEAIRVFGEPSQRSNAEQSQVTSKSAESDILRQQVDMLRKQLELAQEREVFQRKQLQAKDDQIYSLQLLLGAPKPQQQKTPEQEPQQTPEQEPQQTLISESTPITQDEKPESKRYGLFGRVVRAILD